MEDKIRNEHFRRAKLILKRKLNGGNEKNFKMAELDGGNEKNGKMEKKNGGRVLIGYGNSEENGQGWYIKINIEPLLVAVRKSRTLTLEETIDPKEFKKTKEEQ